MKSFPLLSSVLVALVAFCGLAGAAPGVDVKSAGHHEHGAADGVCSLDVYADGHRLHLLTGEPIAGSGHPALLYRNSADDGATWSPALRIDAGMPGAFSLRRGMDAQLVAVGESVMAAWMTAGTDEWGSGPIATAISKDRGKTWLAGPNPADDGSTTGHGFLDIAADRAGAFHLTWLDSRDGKRGLRYARSENGGQSWLANVTVRAGTCECCANTIMASGDGEAVILFRDGNPRDMCLVRSQDRGRRWTAPTPATRFDWAFPGCPHVGGGLAATGQGADAVFHTLSWTGKSGSTGIYYAANIARRPRRLGDETASHPDLTANANGRLVAAWDSRAAGTPGVWAAVSNDAGLSWTDAQILSGSGASASHPRVVPVKNGFRAFWTESRPGKPAVLESRLLP